MLVTIDEIKTYLRIDGNEDDTMVDALMRTAQDMCLVVARCDEKDIREQDMNLMRTAIFYASAFLYEHREEADHNAFLKTLRALLAGVRREGF